MDFKRFLNLSNTVQYSFINNLVAQENKYDLLPFFSNCLPFFEKLAYVLHNLI